ncbi:MAG: undecaprenyl diphosphate synthase family protein [Chromatiales bacterium]|nr:undecaprenyl diphosphate synthase family protein [Chromatiales bacterium]
MPLGHREGCQGGAARWSRRAGEHEIEALTSLFAFSGENWRRPPAEVSLLMDLFHQRAGEGSRQRCTPMACACSVIGDRTPFC